MITIYRIVILLLVIHAHQSIASTHSVTIKIGKKNIYVPAPAGFHEISRLSPETRKLSETMTPPNNRLLAVFVSESDLGRIMKEESPEFGRYMFLQVYRKFENTDASSVLFRQFVDQIKKEQEILLEKVRYKVGPLLDNATGKLSKDLGISMKMKVGEQVSLGVFMEENDAVGFAVLSKVQVSVEGEKLDHLIVSGVAIIRAKGKILYAYIYSNYQTQEDLEWIRNTLRRWVDKILISNISQGSSMQTNSGSMNASSFNWDIAIGKLIFGVIVGGLLGLVSFIILGLKRLVRGKKSSDI